MTVNRIVDTGQFSADVSIDCADCGVAMQFIGMEMGLSPDMPMMSVDGREARMPIRPFVKPEWFPVEEHVRRTN